MPFFSKAITLAAATAVASRPVRGQNPAELRVAQNTTGSAGGGTITAITKRGTQQRSSYHTWDDERSYYENSGSTIAYGFMWYPPQLRAEDYKAGCRCVSKDGKRGLSMCMSAAKVCQTDSSGCGQGEFCGGCRPDDDDIDGDVMTYEECEEQCEDLSMRLLADADDVDTAMGTGCNLDSAEVWVETDVTSWYHIRLDGSAVQYSARVEVVDLDGTVAKPYVFHDNHYLGYLEDFFLPPELRSVNVTVYRMNGDEGYNFHFPLQLGSPEVDLADTLPAANVQHDAIVKFGPTVFVQPRDSNRKGSATDMAVRVNMNEEEVAYLNVVTNENLLGQSALNEDSRKNIEFSEKLVWSRDDMVTPDMLTSLRGAVESARLERLGWARTTLSDVLQTVGTAHGLMQANNDVTSYADLMTALNSVMQVMKGFVTQLKVHEHSILSVIQSGVPDHRLQQYLSTATVETLTPEDYVRQKVVGMFGYGADMLQGMYDAWHLNADALQKKREAEIAMNVLAALEIISSLGVGVVKGAGLWAGKITLQARQAMRKRRFNARKDIMLATRHQEELSRRQQQMMREAADKGEKVTQNDINKLRAEMDEVVRSAEGEVKKFLESTPKSEGGLKGFIPSTGESLKKIKEEGIAEAFNMIRSAFTISLKINGFHTRMEKMIDAENEQGEAMVDFRSWVSPNQSKEVPLPSTLTNSAEYRRYMELARKASLDIIASQTPHMLTRADEEVPAGKLPTFNSMSVWGPNLLPFYDDPNRNGMNKFWSSIDTPKKHMQNNNFNLRTASCLNAAARERGDETRFFVVSERYKIWQKKTTEYLTVFNTRIIRLYNPWFVNRSDGRIMKDSMVPVHASTTDIKIDPTIEMGNEPQLFFFTYCDDGENNNGNCKKRTDTTSSQGFTVPEGGGSGQDVNAAVGTRYARKVPPRPRERL